MRTVQDILFGVSGQSIYFDCPEGRPSSVTSCEVFWWGSSDDDPELTGSGAVETNPNTTIDAASGAGETDPRTVKVTATTGAEVGRTYLVTSAANGAREWFECIGIVSADYLIAKHPLHNAYTTSDTVQSTRISASVDNTWAADEQNLDDEAGPNPSYRVRWVYVVSGVTYVADSYFNLTRYAGKHGVRPQDVELLSAGWIDRLPTDHYRDQGRRLIDEAYRAVKIDLHQVWADDALVANSEILDELTRYKCLEAGELARALNGGGSRDAYEMARTAYMSRFDQLARVTNKVPVRGVDGSAVHVIATPLTRR